MNLGKCLRITKCANFSVFVYQKKHKGIDDAPLKIIDIERNEKGELPYIEFAKCKVKEIIPHSKGVNVVVENNQENLEFEGVKIC